jgi:hypothetical protein
MTDTTKGEGMDKALKAEWVAALRSGEIKQCKGRLLETDGSMCCLGVLEHVCQTPTDVIAAFVDDLSIPLPDADGVRRHQSKNLELRGIDLNMRERLANMNDGNSKEHDYKPLSFSEIADFIEKNL